MDPQEKMVAPGAVSDGLDVMTGAAADRLADDGINWLNQASFEPPLVAAAVSPTARATRW